jgi:hypothetical protein
MYGAVIMGIPLRFGNVIAVRSADDLSQLVKETEGVNGIREREYYVGTGRERQRYRIAAHGIGYEVTRIEQPRNPTVKFYCLPGELNDGPIVAAIRSGMLFCDAL